MGLGRRFWTFWCASALANVGDGIRLAAFPLLAASLSSDPVMVGIAAAAATVPWLLTGLYAGSLADRYGARTLIRVAELSRIAVLSGLIAMLLSDRATIGAVAAAAFLLGAGETMRDTAAQTVIPRLVPSVLLERANGRLSAVELVGNEFVGPLVGGVLFGAGVALPFMVNGATAALGLFLVLSLPGAVLSMAVSRSERSEHTGRGIKIGLLWLGRQRFLKVLMTTVAFVAVADSAWFSIFVVYSNRTLGLGPAGFGALLALGAVGGLAGALGADRLIARLRHRTVIGWAATVAAVTPCALLMIADIWVARAVVLITSGAFGVLNVAAMSLRHRLVPAELLGRVSATWRVSVYGAGAVGALVGGALASAYGLDAPFLLSGALGMAIAIAWARTSVRVPDAIT